MAKQSQSETSAPDGEGKPKSGMMGMIIDLALATLIAAGAGGGYAFFVQKKPAVAEQAAKPAKAEPEAPKGKEAEISGLIALQPIITNLAAPAGIWIRLESSIFVENMLAKDQDALRKDVTEDILAFLRTLALPQIEGPMGFLHLREDLNERVQNRSKGKAREIVIHTMVLQ